MPYQEWLDAGLFHLDELPPGDYVRMPHHRVVLRQQAFGYTYEELNLLVAPMARTGAEPLGLDGHRHPGRRAVAAAADALRLLPAAVRPGHQPAAGRHPRRGGDQPVGHRRPRGRPAQPRRRVVSADRAAAADPAQRRAVEADLRRPRPRDPRPQARDARRGDPLPVPGEPGRAGPQGGAGQRPRQGVGGHPRRRAHHRAVRPRVRRADGADPVAAERVGRAPPPGSRPHPHPGRARRRGRRRPRGAPHGRASSASAPPRSTRTWRSSRSRTWSTAA